MTITYGIVEEIYTFNGRSRFSYGLIAYTDIMKDGTFIVVTSVHDITSDRNRLTEEIQKYNRSELSLIHLSDVIDDFLAD